MLHTECFESLKSHAEKKKSPLICPLCREPVDVQKIVRKQLLALEHDVQEDDPFAIGEAMQAIQWSYQPSVVMPDPQSNTDQEKHVAPSEIEMK